MGDKGVHEIVPQISQLPQSSYKSKDKIQCTVALVKLFSDFRP